MMRTIVALVITPAVTTWCVKEPLAHVRMVLRTVMVTRAMAARSISTVPCHVVHVVFSVHPTKFVLRGAVYAKKPSRTVTSTLRMAVKPL